MSDGFPTGEFKVMASDVVLFPKDGILAIARDDVLDYVVTTPDGLFLPMTLAGNGCLEGEHLSRSLVICQTGVTPVRIAGIVTVLRDFEGNGGGQWTAEEGGGPVDT